MTEGVEVPFDSVLRCRTSLRTGSSPPTAALGMTGWGMGGRRIASAGSSRRNKRDPSRSFGMTDGGRQTAGGRGNARPTERRRLAQLEFSLDENFWWKRGSIPMWRN